MRYTDGACREHTHAASRELGEPDARLASVVPTHVDRTVFRSIRVRRAGDEGRDLVIRVEFQCTERGTRWRAPGGDWSPAFRHFTTAQANAATAIRAAHAVPKRVQLFSGVVHRTLSHRVLIACASFGVGVVVTKEDVAVRAFELYPTAFALAKRSPGVDDGRALPHSTQAFKYLCSTSTNSREGYIERTGDGGVFVTKRGHEAAKRYQAEDSK